MRCSLKDGFIILLIVFFTPSEGKDYPLFLYKNSIADRPINFNDFLAMSRVRQSLDSFPNLRDYDRNAHKIVKKQMTSSDYKHAQKNKRSVFSSQESSSCEDGIKYKHREKINQAMAANASGDKCSLKKSEFPEVNFEEPSALERGKQLTKTFTKRNFRLRRGVLSKTTSPFRKKAHQAQERITDSLAEKMNGIVRVMGNTTEKAPGCTYAKEKQTNTATEKSMQREYEKELQRSTEKPMQKELEKELQRPTEKPMQREYEEELQKATEKPMQKEYEKNLQIPTEKPMHKEYEKNLQIPTEKPMQKEHEKELQIPTEKSMQKECEKELQRSTEKPMQKELEKELQRPTEKPMQREYEEELQRPTEKPMQKEYEKELQRPTEKPVQREYEKELQNATEKPMQREYEKELQKATEKPMQGEYEKELQRPTEKPMQREYEKELQKVTEKSMQREYEKELQRATEKAKENENEKTRQKTTYEKPGEKPKMEMDEEQKQKFLEALAKKKYCDLKVKQFEDQCKALKNMVGCKMDNFCRFPDIQNNHCYFECESDSSGCMKLTHKTCPDNEIFSAKFLECLKPFFWKLVERDKRSLWKKGKKQQYSNTWADGQAPNGWTDVTHEEGKQFPSEFRPKYKPKLVVYHLKVKKAVNEQFRNGKKEPRRVSPMPHVIHAETSRRLPQKVASIKNRYHQLFPRSFVIRINKKEGKNDHEEGVSEGEEDTEEDIDDEEDDEEDDEVIEEMNEEDEDVDDEEEDKKPNEKGGIKEFFKSAKEAITSRARFNDPADASFTLDKTNPYSKNKNFDESEKDSKKILIDADIKVDKTLGKTLKRILAKRKDKDFSFDENLKLDQENQDQMESGQITMFENMIRSNPRLKRYFLGSLGEREN